MNIIPCVENYSEKQDTYKYVAEKIKSAKENGYYFEAAWLLCGKIEDETLTFLKLLKIVTKEEKCYAIEFNQPNEKVLMPILYPKMNINEGSIELTLNRKLEIIGLLLKKDKHIIDDLFVNQVFSTLKTLRNHDQLKDSISNLKGSLIIRHQLIHSMCLKRIQFVESSLVEFINKCEECCKELNKANNSLKYRLKKNPL